MICPVLVCFHVASVSEAILCQSYIGESQAYSAKDHKNVTGKLFLLAPSSSIFLWIMFSL